MPTILSIAFKNSHKQNFREPLDANRLSSPNLIARQTEIKLSDNIKIVRSRAQTAKTYAHVIYYCRLDYSSLTKALPAAA